jgi:hypothetical protein
MWDVMMSGLNRNKTGFVAFIINHWGYETRDESTRQGQMNHPINE